MVRSLYTGTDESPREAFDGGYCTRRAIANNQQTPVLFRSDGAALR
jgi:hypothetical protein